MIYRSLCCVPGAGAELPERWQEGASRKRSLQTHVAGADLTR